MIPRRSPILSVGVDSVFHTILLLSLFLLLTGHNAPGGGFIGGLVAGSAFVLCYVSGAVPAVAERAPVSPRVLFGFGLVIALASGIVPMLAGQPFLDSGVIERELPLFGSVKLVTVLFFDIGVYLIVVGLVLSVLRVLGEDALPEEEQADEPRGPEVGPTP
jgi:multicomponent Na+:H+ antiporter subunit A